MKSVTKRYVFVIEYCCQPTGREGKPRNCYGWVRYRSSDAKDEIKKAFKDMSDLPQVINEIVILDGEKED